MKVGFIGAGKMAQAIIKGLDSNRFDLSISSRNSEKTKDLAQKLAVNFCEDNRSLAQSVDVIVLSVKPQIIPQVIEEIRGELAGKKIISIAAGLNLARLQDLIQEQVEIIRVMPNINAEISQSTTAICPNELSSPDFVAITKEIFASIGQVYQIEEKDFQTFSAIAGSSPAFIYIFIDALSRAAVRYGMPKDLATEIVAQTVSASGQMVSQSKENPWALVDKVSSPGGTTIEGIVSLEENKFVASVIDAVSKTIEKDKSL
ncbi:pyrroline-5-carboxylate reductase [Streptococcaceae bacterium ESL0729]|nr:pyrroline-5-carboxylate reductase [Streptococcaceae bacterium ESL0729]